MLFILYSKFSIEFEHNYIPLYGCIKVCKTFVIVHGLNNPLLNDELCEVNLQE